MFLQVFLTHLHSDHHADLASLYVGAMFGRRTPWEVWGPSGEQQQYGTAAAIEGLRQVREHTVADVVIRK
jgi:ribonuclease Z